MRKSYLNQGFDTIEKIGSKYCASGCAGWVPNVTGFYTEQGGDTSALTFSRTLIDFETFTGPSVFSGVQPPLTIGIATISGGQIIRGATFLPADQSVVYGTAFFCPGCLPTVKIDFSQKVQGLSLFVYNGQTFTVTYTVQDDVGDVKTFSLVSNANSGATTVALPTAGIRHVTVTSNAANWDFFVDNIRFAPM
jgi:hypothetical protein